MYELEGKTLYNGSVTDNPRIVLSVITVAAYDLRRLKITLDSFQGSASEVEFVVVCPRQDTETIRFLNSFLSKTKLRLSVHHDDGIGVYEAMNQGAKFSTGEYLVFWNAGDTCNSSAGLSELCDNLRSSSWSWVITQAIFDWRGPQIMSEQNLKNFVIQFGGYISHQTVIMRKLEFMALGGFDADLKVAADTKLITQFWKKFDVNFYNLELVKVEFPKFSAEHNRLGRLENLKLCIFELPIRYKAISVGVALCREMRYAFYRAKKIVSRFEEI